MSNIVPADPIVSGEIIPPGDDSIAVFACPHPFKMERVEHRFPAGVNLAQIVHTVQPRRALNRFCRVHIGEMEVPREKWHSVRPHPGTTVTVRAVPQGGGGTKNILRIVLMLVVVVAATVLSFGAGGFLGGAFLGTTLTVGQALGAAVGLVGPIQMNALLPPRRRNHDLLDRNTDGSNRLDIARHRGDPHDTGDHSGDAGDGPRLVSRRCRAIARVA